jgi:hypothetical protein
MASPFRKDQLSPAMVERYGLDRRPWASWILGGALIAVFAVALVFVAFAITRNTGANELLAWEVRSQEHVTVTFAVRRQNGEALECAIRAQDRTNVDVAYAIVEVPAGPDSVQQVTELRTLTVPNVVEVLGCAPRGELSVMRSQFPPGVVPPAQPWTP